MDQIKMVDLLVQHNQIREEIDSAIKAVIDSSAFIKGKPVQAFEENLAILKEVDVAGTTGVYDVKIIKVQ